MDVNRLKKKVESVFLGKKLQSCRKLSNDEMKFETSPIYRIEIESNIIIFQVKEVYYDDFMNIDGSKDKVRKQYRSFEFATEDLTTKLQNIISKEFSKKFKVRLGVY